jgi:hypothetical protein
MNSLFTAGYLKGREHERKHLTHLIRIEIYKAQIDGDQYAEAALQDLADHLQLDTDLNNGELASE